MSTTLIPHICCSNCAEAIEFYKGAFGATEMMVMKTPDNKVMHGSLNIDGATLYLVDEFPDFGALGPKGVGGTPVTLHLQVSDCDAVFNKAVAAGCTAIMPLADMFWGDRYGLIVDPYGHKWSIATTVRQVSPEEMEKAMLSMTGEECAQGGPENA